MSQRLGPIPATFLAHFGPNKFIGIAKPLGHQPSNARLMSQGNGTSLHLIALRMAKLHHGLATPWGHSVQKFHILHFATH
jgi:hypothetical protein